MHAKLKALRHNADCLESDLRKIRNEIGHLERSVIIQKSPELDKDTLEIGDWSCPDSPIEVCVYDWNSAMGTDECVYCGQPEERK